MIIRGTMDEVQEVLEHILMIPIEEVRGIFRESLIIPETEYSVEMLIFNAVLCR
jgi:hypothetical protein